ncbi:MAG: ion transporter, partial [Betaproteobacteria bacterium]|nr:ion transporter [Betaproteobacteria bacterium]
METTTDTSTTLRQRLGDWLETPTVRNGLIALILLNAVILGLETSTRLMEQWGAWLSAADRAILAVFVVEIALRLFVHRLAFFRDPWNVFDFAVVAIALVPASGPLAGLRALRSLRVLRLITLVPSMKRVVGGLLAALPGLGSVVAIICIIFYVAAVISTELFAAEFPALFGDLGRSAFTLFQVMTLEGWAMEVVRPVMAVYPLSWIFFLTFILASTFTLLNLFIAVIVNAIHQEGNDERRDATAAELVRLSDEIAALRRPAAGLPCAARAAQRVRLEHAARAGTLAPALGSAFSVSRLGAE